MITVIQRVSQAEVLIGANTYSEIEKGYVILLGIFDDDNEQDVKKMADKIANLRVIADKEGKMNLSITDVKGEILLVSQFTLCADTTQRRPSFIRAKKPEDAKKLYELLIQKLKEKNIPVKTGQFGQYMGVQIYNDGPVTIIINSKN